MYTRIYWLIDAAKKSQSTQVMTTMMANEAAYAIRMILNETNIIIK